MKKVFFINLFVWMTLITVSSGINNLPVIVVNLYLETNEGENNVDKDGLHRSLHCAVIKDNVITFDAFDEDCSMQIVDVDNDLVIHEEFIFSGDTECMLPVLSSGNYKVKFVGYETVYSGYFEIR